MSKKDSENNILLAPNGKPSNLTSEQYNIVRTTAFKKWFGDWENDPKNSSKVIDDNGEPLVVYNGTIHKFNVFDREQIGYLHHKLSKITKTGGFFFTDKYNVALSYVYRADQTISQKIKREFQGKVSAFFLNIKDIYVAEGGNKWECVFSSKTECFSTDDISRSVYTLRDNDGVVFKNVIDTGNDKISIEPSNIFVAFQSNQIKLADGTNINFDNDNPDIRFEKGAKIEHGKFDLGKHHNPFIKVVKGGSCCANCKFLTENKKNCSNNLFVQWYGKSELPKNIDEICSDWYVPNPKYLKDGGCITKKLLFSGGGVGGKKIDDSAYSFKLSISELYTAYKKGRFFYLDQLIVHKDLFEKYPIVASVPVYLGSISNEDTLSDSYVSGLIIGDTTLKNVKIQLNLHFDYYGKYGTEFIELTTTDVPECSKESVILHELQHICQSLNLREIGRSKDSIYSTVRKEIRSEIGIRGLREQEEKGVVEDTAIYFYKRQLPEQEAMATVYDWLKSQGLNYGQTKYLFFLRDRLDDDFLQSQEHHEMGGEVLDKQQIIGLFIVTADTGKILMLERADGDFIGKWGILTGHVEPNESVHKAVFRETKEETGIDISKIKYLSETDNIHYNFHYYVAVIPTEVDVVLDSENSNYKWASHNEMYDNAHPKLVEYLNNNGVDHLKN